MPLKGTRLPLSGERILLKYSWSWQRKTCRRSRPVARPKMGMKAVYSK